MFTILRLILGILFLAVGIVLITKTNRNHKKRNIIIYSVIVVILFIVSTLIPLENAFFTFESPEAAYCYYNFGAVEVDLVVEGRYCDFVIGRKNNVDVHQMIPKNDNGWKIGVGSDIKTVVQKIVDDVVIYVYQYKNSRDYFLVAVNTNSGPLEITDSLDSIFLNLVRRNEQLEEDFISYYASIPECDSTYLLHINGKGIAVFEVVP